jgi:DNA helicase-2/ATP-dependent DNA helicase PcrA
MFVWPKGDLNTEQEAAIEEAGNVFLVACPGSGKTRALTYKIALELSKLTSKKQWVIAITYTHRAADEIQERIERLGVDTTQLWIGTIHSFCLEWILRPYALYHEALKHGFRIINPHEAEKLLTELGANSPHRVRFFECAHYFTSDGCTLTSTNRQRHVAIRNVLEQYWTILGEQRQIDFEQVLRYSHDLISSEPTIKTLLGSLFAWVLVDELQDTKEIQYAILGMILRASGGRTNAFVVGDPNQAIYGSLGGYAISCADFVHLSGLQMVEKGLVINYRSSRRIVEYFSHYHLQPAAISAEGDQKDYSSLISFDRHTGRNGLEDELVRLIRYSVETLGTAPNEICIIAPWWMQLASMTRRLVAALPEYSFDGPGMAPFARDIDNFWYKLSRIVLTEPSPYLYVRRIRWAGEILSALEHAGIDVSTLSRKGLLRECNSIAIAVDEGLTYLELFFDELFERLKIDFRAVPTLAEHHQSFFESSADRIEKLAREGGQAVSDISMFRKVFASRSGITVSTIHGVKGAEFDTVIAYALLEGMVPHFSDGNGPDSANKLLYVLCSRARKNLHLISETGRVDGRGHDYEPTETLAACAFVYDLVPN